MSYVKVTIICTNFFPIFSFDFPGMSVTFLFVLNNWVLYNQI